SKTRRRRSTRGYGRIPRSPARGVLCDSEFPGRRGFAANSPLLSGSFPTRGKVSRVPACSFVARPLDIRDAVDPRELTYEIVITDDCSQDRSWAILKGLAAGDPRDLPKSLDALKQFDCVCGTGPGTRAQGDGF